MSLKKFFPFLKLSVFADNYFFCSFDILFLKCYSYGNNYSNYCNHNYNNYFRGGEPDERTK